MVMVIGNLYEICNYTVWTLPRGANPETGYRFWSDCGPVVYLGVTDGSTTQKTHAIWVRGRRRVVPNSFLHHFRPLTTP